MKMRVSPTKRTAHHREQPTDTNKNPSWIALPLSDSRAMYWVATINQIVVPPPLVAYPFGFDTPLDLFTVRWLEPMD